MKIKTKNLLELLYKKHGQALVSAFVGGIFEREDYSFEELLAYIADFTDEEINEILTTNYFIS